MEKPKVVIGIVTFNRIKLLEKAIHSSISQDYPNSIIAVYDNGSDYQNSQRSNFDSNIIFLNGLEKRTIVEAKNILMKSFEYDYFVWLDDDAYFLENDSITKAVGIMESKKNIGALALDIYSPNNSLSLFPDKFPTQKAVFVGCGCVLRHEAIKQCNYYSETIGYYGGEEQDLSLKMLDQNYVVYFSPGIRVWHEISNQGRDEYNQWKSQVCNSFSSLIKFYPIPIILILVPYRLIRLGVFSVRKRIFIKYFKGIIFFIQTFNKSWNNRMPVKRSTVVKYHKLLRSDKLNH